MVEFSIIIPVYNAEKTLERCLESIRGQCFSNYEVILIDDGSSDNSFKICTQYAEKDCRYFVVHQENRGPSAARNIGVDIAKGKWICFVDSDDSISYDYLQTIFDVVQKEEAEAIFLGYYKVSENGEKEECIPINAYDNDKVKTLMALSENDMFGYTWIKCLKKEIIRDVRFDETLNLFEDEIFTCYIMQNCKKINVIKKAIYNYFLGNANSLIGRTHEDYCLKCDRVYRAWDKMLEGYSGKRSFMNHKANSFVSRSYYYAFERKIDIRYYFGQLKDTMYFENHTNQNVLDEFVKKGNYLKLYFAKMKYRIKIDIAKCLHRRK